MRPGGEGAVAGGAVCLDFVMFPNCYSHSSRIWR